MTEALLERREKDASAAEFASEDHARSLGRRGIECAAKYLEGRGYDVLEREWSCRAGRADLIACDGDTIAFAAVRTWEDAEQGFPPSEVARDAYGRMERAALAYLASCGGCDVRVRLDVLDVVVLSADRAMLRHTIGASPAA